MRQNNYLFILGHIYFDLYRSPNAYLAFNEARKVIIELAEKKVNN